MTFATMIKRLIGDGGPSLVRWRGAGDLPSLGLTVLASIDIC